MARTTHTYAMLELTQPAFDEIKAKLEKAGYQDQFHNEIDGLFIDMHGIAVCGPDQETCEHEWAGHKNPDTPDGPGEWIEYCKKCGMENPGSCIEEDEIAPAVKKAQLVFKQQLQLKDAAMLIARLSHAIAPSASHLKDQALDWLKRNDLAPSILR